MTLYEASEHLGITAQAVLKLIKLGRIRAEKIPVGGTAYKIWNVDYMSLKNYEANRVPRGRPKNTDLIITIKKLFEQRMNSEQISKKLKIRRNRIDRYLKAIKC